MNKKTMLCLLIQTCIATKIYAEIPSEEILASIWINQLNMNQDIVVLKQNDRYYIDCQILADRDVDLSKLDRSASNAHFCAVSNEQKDITAQFDESSQSLKVDIATNLFKHQNASDTQQKVTPANFGGFINYELFYNYQDNNQNTNQSYNTLIQLGLFKDYWLFNNTFAYYNEADLNKTVRVNTTLQFDFPEKLTNLVIGDATTPYNPLINSLRFGGISWGTNYQSRPGFVYWNVPSLQGSAKVPSTVDLYINGVSVYQQQVTPGDYNLQVGANLQQTGNAQIVVEDILGNRSVQSFPVLLSNQLLRPGLNDYNISLGKLRYNYNLDSSDYRNFFTSGFFRRGISQNISLGFNAAYSQDIQNLGIMWTQAVAHSVVVDLLAMSSYDKKSHLSSAYGFSTSKEFKRVSLGLSSRYQERNYKFIGDELTDSFAPIKFENLVYLSFSKIPWLDNINLNYAEQRYYTSNNPSSRNQDNKVFTLGFTRRVTPKLDLQVNYFNAFGATKNSGAVLALTYRFDQNKAIHAAQSTNNESNLQFAQYSNQQTGLDYSVGVNRRNNQNVYSFDGRYKTNVGDLDFQYYKTHSGNQAQLNFSGSMVWLANQFAFTKSVNNAFALVKVDQYPNIDLYLTNSLVNKTNKNGYAFIHNIIPYVPSEINLNQDQLPVDDKILSSSYVLTGLNQRGYVINYPIYHAQNITVRPLTTDHKPFAKGSELHINNPEKDIYPIGSDGTATLYSLIPGQYQLDIFSSSPNQCRTQLTVSDQIKEDQVLDLICQ
ncbi:fimbria/pilus outer membrane usher protein [Acinetobacter sp. MD2]|uniref:fimbria/pilus outer membrane usher protein n=1 Tax=Acinetobacter sp. MD2 TaxID=2600066 RepID=UPI002D1F1D58|nr:fimbria/pilus outer membrane usher protein [Acinetobacter sp. MD2]MEB3767321.1 fimbrial biogenesis outer membrane usher protein [Acinetobacter sp. MD2]